MTTNPDYGACPVGMAVFFPCLIEPPNSDWVLCDGAEYDKGIYPQMDAVHANRPTNCRVDSPIYSDEGNDKIKVTASYAYSPLDYYKPINMFRENVPTIDAGECWMADTALTTRDNPTTVTITLKNDIRRRFTGVELRAPMTFGGFPKKFKFYGAADGESWELTSEISIDVAPAAGKILYFPFIVDPREPPASTLSLQIYERHDRDNATIARMRLFAKEDKKLIIPKINADLSKQKGIWCLRVSR